MYLPSHLTKSSMQHNFIFLKRSTVSFNWAIGLMSRVFANRTGDQGSHPGHVIPKTQKVVLDAALLNNQHYNVQIKSKLKQYRERSGTLPNTLVQ